MLRLEIGTKVESVSGDKDADAFAVASAKDFSFFDDDGGGGGGDDKEGGERVDFRAELRKWRKEMAGGDGHWGGKLEVVVKAEEEDE